MSGSSQQSWSWMPLEHLLGNLFSSALEVWLGQWWWWWMSSTGEGLSPPWDTVAEGPPPPPPPPSTSLLCFPLFFPGSQTPQSVAEGKQRRMWGRGGAKHPQTKIWILSRMAWRQMGHTVRAELQSGHEPWPHWNTSLIWSSMQMGQVILSSICR